MPRISCLLAAGVLLASRLHAAPPPPPPRIVVVIVIDQFPQEFLERMRGGFAPNGFFARVLQGGAVFTDCRHDHALTVTGGGHATLATGSAADLHGIIGNDWYDLALKRSVNCVEDSDYPVIGGPAKAGEGVSPSRLLVPALGDVLKLHTAGKAKVFGLALKDRAAILMAGHAADGAFWFDATSGHWISSTYYGPELPPYVTSINTGDAVERLAGQSWELLLPIEQYAEHYPDDAKYESNPAWFGRKFPHRLPPADEAGMYRGLVPLTPFASDLTFELAQAIIEHEQLGADNVPDLLWIGLSANDMVGHLYGPFSREVEDLTYRTDRQLGALLDYLDQEFPRSWTVALSADHGVGPVPEHAAELGLRAQRDALGDVKKLQQVLEDAVRARLGPPPADAAYVLAIDETGVYLDTALPQMSGSNTEIAHRAVRDALRRQPLVAAAFTREQVENGVEASGLLRKFQLSYHPLRSGDVQFALRPYCIVGGNRATHGGPWNYDSHVPLALLGAGVRAGIHHQPTSTTQLAPTLARLLRIPPPPACFSAALLEALREPEQLSESRK